MQANLSDPSLWQKLQAAPLDLSLRPLAEAAEEKTGHSARRIARVLTEYRRFLYLVAVGGQVLAPSRLVDEIWHLHLADPEAYRAFCLPLFGREIRHIEGRPPPAKDPAYEATRAAIRQEFGTGPFHRIWPAPHQEQRSARIGVAAGMILLLGFVAAFSGHPVMLAAAAPVSFSGLIVLALTGPWPVAKTSGGGCGGSADDSSGCGGD